MEWFFTILVFFGIMVLTAVLFGGWVIVSLGRMIYRAFQGPRNASPQLTTQVSQTQRCTRASCRSENPQEAALLPALRTADAGSPARRGTPGGDVVIDRVAPENN